MEEIEQFKAEMATLGLSALTIERYLQHVEQFFSVIQKPPAKVLPKDIYAFLLWKAEQEKKRHKEAQSRQVKGLGKGYGRLAAQEGKLKANTNSVVISALKHFFRANDLPIAAKIISPKISKWSPIMIEKKDIEITITPQTMISFYGDRANAAYYAQRDFLLLAFICATGARISECSHLRQVDLKFQRKIPKVELEGKGTKREVEVGKWIELYDKFKIIAPKNEFVFCSKKGTQLNAKSLALIIKKHTGFSPHKFRHLFVVRSIGMKKPAGKVQEEAGHKSLETTGIYLRLLKSSDEKFGSAFDSLF